MNKDVTERVIRILNSVTGRNYEHVDLKSDLASQLCLDSIQMVDLFAALEMEFNIELPLKMMNAKTGEDFFDMFMDELNQSSAA
ncbi:MAG: hypothetical protein GVY19_13180 [Bacteroidetes bacterium]|jgi:acyl carrier protein|nr:hypothetical protein [Bacteroidota bacterium]